MVMACYQGQYSLLVKRIKHVRTITEAKKYKATYRKMMELANKADNEKGVEFARNMLRKL
ncbi:MAG: hypothetical protein Q8P27_02420, partial [Candidatus Peregrinibacteria bacterium]|nr:hypothetical protein [Candidatus Peregrinibacteria bacterium]